MKFELSTELKGLKSNEKKLEKVQAVVEKILNRAEITDCEIGFVTGKS